MSRIAVGGFQHETNSFVPGRTDFDYFLSHRDRPPLVRGPAVLEWLADTSFALSGFLQAMQARHEIVPLVWTSGGAGAPVTRDAFERISAELVGRLSEALPVQGVYLDLHGAMVTEDFEDGEGELLRRVRAVVGDAIPVVISLDYHANVTPDMVRLCDSILGYLTYPHIDRLATGQRAAAVLQAVLGKGRPIGRSLRKAPFLIPLNGQCTLVEPSRAVVSQCKELQEGLVSLAYLAGFPPSDLFYCGPSVVAYAWDQPTADRAADQLAREVYLREDAFAEEMVTPREGVRRAMAATHDSFGPIVLADTQDNPGCGGTSDTTGLVEALVTAGAQSAVVGFLCDPQAAAVAHLAGVGADISLALGGRSGPDGVKPVNGTFRVEALHSGKIRTTGQVSGGRDIDLGPMALLAVGGVRIAVTSKRMQALDQAPFRALGVEPAQERILGLKSTCHFRAEFEPLAREVIVVLAPGRYLADPSHYPYRRLRPGVRLRPLGPEWTGAVDGSD